jgi:hypothetical protein
MDVYTLYTCLYESRTNRAQDACTRRQILDQNLVIVEFHNSKAISTAVFLRSTRYWGASKLFWPSTLWMLQMQYLTVLCLGPYHP